MASLSDLVSSRITPEVMQKLAGLAGISPTDTKRALDAIVPTQFDGLASMGATEAGARRLLALLQEHKGTESFAQVLLAGEAWRARLRSVTPCRPRSMAVIATAASAAWRRPSAFPRAPPHR
jgi:hypothetical protein